jgi:hypothetical protein
MALLPGLLPEIIPRPSAHRRFREATTIRAPI